MMPHCLLNRNVIVAKAPGILCFFVLFSPKISGDPPNSRQYSVRNVSGIPGVEKLSCSFLVPVCQVVTAEGSVYRLSYEALRIASSAERTVGSSSHSNKPLAPRRYLLGMTWQQRVT